MGDSHLGGPTLFLYSIQFLHPHPCHPTSTHHLSSFSSELAQAMYTSASAQCSCGPLSLPYMSPSALSHLGQPVPSVPCSNGNFCLNTYFSDSSLPAFWRPSCLVNRLVLTDQSKEVSNTIINTNNNLLLYSRQALC